VERVPGWGVFGCDGLVASRRVAAADPDVHAPWTVPRSCSPCACLRRGRRAASTTLPRKMASPATVTAMMIQIPVADVVMSCILSHSADCRKTLPFALFGHRFWVRGTLGRGRGGTVMRRRFPARSRASAVTKVLAVAGRVFR